MYMRPPLVALSRNTRLEPRKTIVHRQVAGGRAGRSVRLSREPLKLTGPDSAADGDRADAQQRRYLLDRELAGQVLRWSVAYVLTVGYAKARFGSGRLF